MPDAVKKQQDLDKYLSFFDHTLLSESVAWSENLGQRITEDLGCEKVEIRRPLERIYSSVEAL